MPPRLGPLDPEILLLVGVAGAALAGFSYVVYSLAQQIGASIEILPPLPRLPALPGTIRR